MVGQVINLGHTVAAFTSMTEVLPSVKPTATLVVSSSICKPKCDTSSHSAIHQQYTKTFQQPTAAFFSGMAITQSSIELPKHLVYSRNLIGLLTPLITEAMTTPSWTRVFKEGDLGGFVAEARNADEEHWAVLQIPSPPHLMGRRLGSTLGWSCTGTCS